MPSENEENEYISAICDWVSIRTRESKYKMEKVQMKNHQVFG